MKKWSPSFLALVTAIALGGTVSFAVPEESEFVDASADIVEFHIPNGTGSGPWNSRAAPVEVRMGQTLRIVNDDTIAHRLHTFDRPCPHQGPDSRPGEFYDCVVATTADPDVDLLYDHNFGARSRFYVRAIR